jgi:hypothetical protein
MNETMEDDNRRDRDNKFSTRHYEMPYENQDRVSIKDAD